MPRRSDGISAGRGPLKQVLKQVLSPGNAAIFVLVRILTWVAFWRGYFWVGLILLALLSGMGLLL